LLQVVASGLTLAELVRLHKVCSKTRYLRPAWRHVNFTQLAPALLQLPVVSRVFELVSGPIHAVTWAKASLTWSDLNRIKVLEHLHELHLTFFDINYLPLVSEMSHLRMLELAFSFRKNNEASIKEVKKLPLLRRLRIVSLQEHCTHAAIGLCGEKVETITLKNHVWPRTVDDCIGLPALNSLTLQFSTKINWGHLFERARSPDLSIEFGSDQYEPPIQCPLIASKCLALLQAAYEFRIRLRRVNHKIEYHILHLEIDVAHLQTHEYFVERLSAYRFIPLQGSGSEQAQLVQLLLYPASRLLLHVKSRTCVIPAIPVGSVLKHLTFVGVIFEFAQDFDPGNLTSISFYCTSLIPCPGARVVQLQHHKRVLFS
jgi:hypothetical protein